MKSEDVNKLVVIVASIFLIGIIYVKSVGVVCFSAIDILTSYAILVYDIVSQIYFIVVN